MASLLSQAAGALGDLGKGAVGFADDIWEGASSRFPRSLPGVSSAFPRRMPNPMALASRLPLPEMSPFGRALGGVGKGLLNMGESLTGQLSRGMPFAGAADDVVGGGRSLLSKLGGGVKALGKGALLELPLALAAGNIGENIGNKLFDKPDLTGSWLTPPWMRHAKDASGGEGGGAAGLPLGNVALQQYGIGPDEFAQAEQMAGVLKQAGFSDEEARTYAYQGILGRLQAGPQQGGGVQAPDIMAYQLLASQFMSPYVSMLNDIAGQVSDPNLRSIFQQQAASYGLAPQAYAAIADLQAREDAASMGGGTASLDDALAQIMAQQGG